MVKKKVVKVNVSMVVEVDVDAWNAEYGSDESPDLIKSAVRDMLGSASVEALRHLMSGDDPAVISFNRPF